MTEPTGPGPYRAPNLEHVTDSDGLKKPGALATFLIVAFTIIAGVVTFFVTCFGVGILSFEVLKGGAILLGIGLGAGATLVVSTALYRILYSAVQPSSTVSVEHHRNEQP